MHLKAMIVRVALVVALVGWTGASAQQVDQVIKSIGGLPLIRPVQLALSPSGDRLAVCDQQANRIYVIDTDGNPLWTVGEGTMVTRPVLLYFESDDALLYYVENERRIYRAREIEPDAPDTVAVIEEGQLGGSELDRLIPLDKGKKGYLILDREKGTVTRLKPNWRVDKKLISQGSGRGRIWAPTDFTVDLSGNIIVSDVSGCPVQAFTSDGRSLFCGSWNLTEPQRSWEASAVGMGPGETIWAADVTGLTWRVFDRAGIQISQYPFEAPLFRPNDIVATPDNRMFVADDNGAIIVISLP